MVFKYPPSTLFENISYSCFSMQMYIITLHVNSLTPKCCCGLFLTHFKLHNVHPSTLSVFKKNCWNTAEEKQKQIITKNVTLSVNETSTNERALVTFTHVVVFRALEWLLVSKHFEGIQFHCVQSHQRTSNTQTTANCWRCERFQMDRYGKMCRDS